MAESDQQRMRRILATRNAEAAKQREENRRLLEEGAPELLTWLDGVKKSSPTRGSSTSRSTANGFRRGQQWSFADRAFKD
jgi:hypothetical protein